MSDAVIPSVTDDVRAVAARRDRAAFGRVFEHFGPRLKSYLLRRGAAADIADELVQETLLAVWHRAESYDAERAHVSTWVFTIARNKWVDRLRKERWTTVDEEDTPEAPPPGYSWDELASEQQRMRAALEELPEEQALLIQKVYFEDMSHSSVADELSIPVGTVKSRIRLALQRLRVRYRAGGAVA